MALRTSRKDHEYEISGKILIRKPAFVNLPSILTGIYPNRTTRLFLKILALFIPVAGNDQLTKAQQGNDMCSRQGVGVIISVVRDLVVPRKRIGDYPRFFF